MDLQKLIDSFDYNTKDCEMKMQIFIKQWIDQCTNLSLSFFHFANERKTSHVQGNLLKKMGVTSGVSDIFITKSTQCNTYKGTWIELKSPGKKPTASQLSFIEQRKAEGYEAFWSDNIGFVINRISSLYSLPER